MSPLSAQRPSERQVRPGMERIDQEEGARRLELFRQQRLEGDYIFEFRLEHKPRKSSRTYRYDGIMWGSWNDQGAITRFKIFTGEKTTDKSEKFIELIVQNGLSPKAWIRRDVSDTFQLVEGESLFEPLLEGPLYSVFDLQMPFLYWTDFVYEGPSLIRASRVAQNFVMLPPEGSQSRLRGIKGVRVALDEDYNALWNIEVIKDDGSVRSKFEVRSFQKVGGQYIVKKITLMDYPSKDSTTFHVRDAIVGLKLNDELFEINEIGSAD